VRAWLKKRCSFPNGPGGTKVTVDRVPSHAASDAAVAYVRAEGEPSMEWAEQTGAARCGARYEADARTGDRAGRGTRCTAPGTASDLTRGGTWVRTHSASAKTHGAPCGTTQPAPHGTARDKGPGAFGSRGPASPYPPGMTQSPELSGSTLLPVAVSPWPRRSILEPSHSKVGVSQGQRRIRIEVR
jgi:hypothetical protein